MSLLDSLVVGTAEHSPVHLVMVRVSGNVSQVRFVYTKAFTAVPGDDGYSSLSAVQNGDTLHGALDQLRRNFAQAAASSSVELGQLVFTDPQTEVLKFTLHYTDGAPYGTQKGTAVFGNGTWLVSQDS